MNSTLYNHHVNNFLGDYLSKTHPPNHTLITNLMWVKVDHLGHKFMEGDPFKIAKRLGKAYFEAVDKLY